MSGVPPTKVQETLRDNNWDINAAANVLMPTALYVAPEDISHQEQTSKVKTRLQNRLLEAEKLAKAEREAKVKAEREAKAKAEREAKAKAEREAKAKAEREAKVKAEREAKVKAEREAKAKS